MLEQMEKDRYISPNEKAVIMAGLGRRDESLMFLRQAVEEGAPAAIRLAIHPYWDALRTEPAFKQLLNAMQLPES